MVCWAQVPAPTFPWAGETGPNCGASPCLLHQPAPFLPDHTMKIGGCSVHHKIHSSAAIATLGLRQGSDATLQTQPPAPSSQGQPSQPWKGCPSGVGSLEAGTTAATELVHRGATCPRVGALGGPNSPRLGRLQAGPWLPEELHIQHPGWGSPGNRVLTQVQPWVPLQVTWCCPGAASPTARDSFLGRPVIPTPIATPGHQLC